MHIINKTDLPVTLQNMSSPPEFLYIRGELTASKDHKYLCVVGSRRCTRYGLENTRKIISGLAGYPISIVSGLANGIDACAHDSALEAGLHCVAFPGSSLEWYEIQPACRNDLARRIVSSKGALMSRWAPGYHISKWSFPIRNRLMAGISHATLVIEAGKGSGSLLTAKDAENFSRDVCAVPGDIWMPNSYGPHMLIQKGAGLVVDSRDILEILGLEIRHSCNVPTHIHSKDKSGRKNLVMFEDNFLDKLSSSIMQALSIEDHSMSSLLTRTGSQPKDLNEKISLLELEGLIEVTDGSIIRIKRRSS